MFHKMMKIRPDSKYTHAIIAAGLLPPIYIAYSYAVKQIFFPTPTIGIPLYAVFSLSALTGAGVLAWKDGCRISVLTVAAIFVAVPWIGSISFLWISSQGVRTWMLADLSVSALIVIGLEWMARRSEAVTDFFRSRFGRLVLTLGGVHVALGVYLQYLSREYLADMVFSQSFVLLPVPLLPVVSLFSVVVLPVYLWRRHGFVIPGLLVSLWVVWGIWANYLWWSTGRFPISSFYPSGLVAPAAPAPDYALKSEVIFLLEVIAGILEGWVRHDDWY
jgi:hypothetical protein